MAQKHPLNSLKARAARSLGDGADASHILAALETRAIVGPKAEQVAGLARQALERLDQGQTLNDPQRHALEMAIRALRPFVLVQRSVLDPLPKEAASVFGQWDAFRAAVPSVMRSIGKIVLKLPNDITDDVASGFLVGPEQVLTNHHVVRVLSQGSDVILPGVAEIGFGQEFTGSEPGFVAIKRVVAIHPQLDAAIIEVATDGTEGPPIALPTDTLDLNDGTPLAVVGFPLSDEHYQISLSMLGGQGKGKKRGSPGEVLDLGSDTIDHDCSTMPGSSGSPVFSQVGNLVGLHTDGDFGTRNGAIRIDRLVDFIAAVTA